MDKKDELISKLDEYIRFLGEEGIGGKYTGYLYTHHITTPKEIVEKGELMRKEIKELRESIYDNSLSIN